MDAEAYKVIHSPDGLSFLLVGVAVFLILWGFNRIVGQLDKIVSELNEIKNNLVKNNTILEDHERRIMILEDNKK